MDSKSESRTGKDRRQHDLFNSFDVPNGRRWLDRRSRIKSAREMSATRSAPSRGG